VSILTLGKVADYEIFDGLFAATFPSPDVTDIPLLVRVNRSLNQNWDTGKGILDKLEAMTSPVNAVPTQPQGGRPMPLVSDKEGFEHAQNETFKEITAVANVLADLLRKRDGEKPLDLTGTWFPQTDLHDANLVNGDFTGCTLDRLNITGANLRGTPVDSLNNTRWWLAKWIDKDAVVALPQSSYPYSFNDTGIDTSYATAEPVSRKEYESNIATLCAQAGCKLPAAQLRFGPLAKPAASPGP
jgi:Pentapeptide repeats (8 copies)